MELFYCQSLLRRAPTGASSWTTANQPCQGTCSDFSAQQSKPVAADWCYHVERPTWAAEHIKHDHASATEGASGQCDGRRERCRCGGRRERCRCGGSGTEPAQAARAGAALRNRLKFTLGLLIGVQEAEKFAQSSPVSMQKKKASLHWCQISLHPRIRNSQKSLHWCKKSLHWSKKKFTFLMKKFTSFIKKLQKSSYKVNQCKPM